MNPEATPKLNPIEQFELTRIAPLSINGFDVSFTNASLYMLLTMALLIPRLG